MAGVTNDGSWSTSESKFFSFLLLCWSLTSEDPFYSSFMPVVFRVLIVPQAVTNKK